jgi:hypothetical protein
MMLKKKKLVLLNIFHSIKRFSKLLDRVTKWFQSFQMVSPNKCEMGLRACCCCALGHAIGLIGIATQYEKCR